MAMEEEKTVTDERMLVMVPPHPLIKHWISVLRNEQTPCSIFKNALAELGRLLIYEASRDWLGLSSNFREMLVREVALDATGVPLPGETFVAAKESDVVLLGAIDGINGMEMRRI